MCGAFRNQNIFLSHSYGILAIFRISTLADIQISTTDISRVAAIKPPVSESAAQL